MSTVHERLRNLLVVVAIAGGVGWWAYREHAKSGEEAASDVRDAFILDTAQTASTVKVTLTNTHGTFELAKDSAAPDGARWKVLSPLATPADDVTIDGLVRYFSGLRRKSQMSGEDGVLTDLSLFGLEPAKRTLTFENPTGEQRTIYIGKRNSFDGSVYVKLVDSKVVSIVPNSVNYQVDKSLYDLREKRLQPFPVARVQKLHLKLRQLNEHYTIVRVGDDYFIEGEPRLLAERAQVGSMLTALRELKAREFLAEKPTVAQLHAYGLQSPLVEATVDLEGGESVTFRVARASIDGEEKLYGCRAGGYPIAQIFDDGALKKLMQSRLAVRDLHVLKFDRASVRRLGLSSKATSAMFEKKVDEEAGRSEWNQVKPTAHPAKAALLEGVLYKLATLRAVRVAHEAATAEQIAACGLTDAASRIAVYDGSDEPQGTLVVGLATGGELFVMAQGSGRVDVVKKSSIDDISFVADAYQIVAESEAP